MSKGRIVLLLAGFALAAFLIVGGGLVLINSVPVQVTRTEYTGSWGILAALAGLFIAFFCAVAAWDELR